ncbi:hypothetical protein D5086_019764 [Populus alba]|uniref:Uncharacterized protein n=1 Tax=Populus alba TaxID=43335 RepID=A0ACC4BIR6_POPAL
MLCPQTDAATLDKTAFVVLDMESLAQPSDRNNGSPKMTRALSRKWSYRAERWTGNEDEGIDEPAKKLLIKGSSQLDPLKQQLATNKALDPADGWNKRFNRLMAISPRKILFIFATMSSMGTLMLIYFTLAINRST